MNVYAKAGLVGALLLLGGCATVPSMGARQVVVVGSGMVSACKLLGTVTGSSVVEGVAQSVGIQNAKTDAKEQAAKWGANAIVWTDLKQGYWTHEQAAGDAYKCPQRVVSAVSGQASAG